MSEKVEYYIWWFYLLLCLFMFAFLNYQTSYRGLKHKWNGEDNLNFCSILNPTQIKTNQINEINKIIDNQINKIIDNQINKKIDKKKLNK